MGSLDRAFTGGHDALLDEAYRIAIPRNLRTILDVRTSQEKNKIVLTKGPDPCIRLFAFDDFEKRMEHILMADPDTADGREIRRRNIAHLCELDKQGRILIPAELRTHAELSKDCKVVGMFDYIEIWDKDRHLSRECSEEKYQEISERFAILKKEANNAGNSAYPGAAGRDPAVSGAEGHG